MQSASFGDYCQRREQKPDVEGASRAQSKCRIARCRFVCVKRNSPHTNITPLRKFLLASTPKNELECPSASACGKAVANL